MTPDIATALTPLLRRMEAERAHRLAVLAVRLGLAGRDRTGDDPALAMEAFGLRFANPIGLAAGFDKDGVAVRGLSRLGFGFVETGTVTPRAQAGNPTPRVFRLEGDRAVINRYGMNGLGLEAYVARLAGLPRVRRAVVGANVGINKEGAEPERDYPALVAAVAPYADYVVINVSSPNTPGLRDLQGEVMLRRILAAVQEGVPVRPALLVKVAPDLSEAGLEAVVEAAVAHGVDGRDHGEHDDRAGGDAGFGACRAGGGIVGGAADGAEHGDAGAGVSDGGGAAGVGGLRGRGVGGGRAGEGAGGGAAGAGLYGVRVCRAGAGGADEAGARGGDAA